jgi:hypothetical protein
VLGGPYVARGPDVAQACCIRYKTLEFFFEENEPVLLPISSIQQHKNVGCIRYKTLEFFVKKMNQYCCQFHQFNST